MEEQLEAGSAGQGGNGPFVYKNMEEIYPHGSKDFRMSVHKTRIRPETDMVLYYHWHEELEFLSMAKGCAQFRVGSDCFTAKEGDVVLIKPNIPHSAFRKGQGEIVFYAVLVHFSFLSSLENDIIQKKYILPMFLQNQWYPNCITPEMNGEQSVFLNLKTIKNLYLLKKPGYELLVKSKLYEIFYQVNQFSKAGDEKESHPQSSAACNSSLVKNILAYIQQNYTKRITLNDMAKQANMNAAYFSRLFSKIFGLSPVKFLIQFRASEATRLIDTTDKKFTEIAFMTGFPNVNQFTETFKKLYGYTPMQYRENLWQHRAEQNISHYDRNLTEG